VEQRIKEGTARADDNPETVKNRLGVYRNQTAPLLGYYGKQGKVVTVDGMMPIGEVTKAIAAALDKR
jgi:adenylate kinase